VAVDETAIPAYRIEHHRASDARLILACCDNTRRPQMVLAPYADGLLAEGQIGKVVFVDQEPEEIVARRHLCRATNCGRAGPADSAGPNQRDVIPPQPGAYGIAAMERPLGTFGTGPG